MSHEDIGQKLRGSTSSSSKSRMCTRGHVGRLFPGHLCHWATRLCCQRFWGLVGRCCDAFIWVKPRQVMVVLCPQLEVPWGWCLLILLPDPSGTGSSLFCYRCSSVVVALLPASLVWSACSGGGRHLQQEERGFSCDALGCLTLSLSAGRDVLWEQCSCGAVRRKFPKEPVATIKEISIWMTAFMTLNHLCLQLVP